MIFDLSDLSAREVTPADQPFLVRLFAQTHAHGLADVPLPIDQKEALIEMQYRAQQLHYATAFPAREDLLLLWREDPIGRVTLNREVAAVALIDIAVQPEHQGRGIGSSVLRSLVAEEATINLHVEKKNPARNLYQRFGFLVSEDDGVYLTMSRPV